MRSFLIGLIFWCSGACKVSAQIDSFGYDTSLLRGTWDLVRSYTKELSASIEIIERDTNLSYSPKILIIKGDSIIMENHNGTIVRSTYKPDPGKHFYSIRSGKKKSFDRFTIYKLDNDEMILGQFHYRGRKSNRVYHRFTRDSERVEYPKRHISEKNLTGLWYTCEKDSLYKLDTVLLFRSLHCDTFTLDLNLKNDPEGTNQYQSSRSRHRGWLHTSEWPVEDEWRLDMKNAILELRRSGYRYRYKIQYFNGNELILIRIPTNRP